MHAPNGLVATPSYAAKEGLHTNVAVSSLVVKIQLAAPRAPVDVLSFLTNFRFLFAFAFLLEARLLVSSHEVW